MAIKILIGGSPCTYWSIAQTNNRETKAEGMGWELFKNYLIAKEKFKPDFFLYENNKSASQAIKDQIAEEFGVGVDPNVRFTYINSALVSAQNRQRFYVTNFGDIEQPEDRGILLKDILETGQPRSEKSPCIDANYYKGGNLSNLEKQSGDRLQVAEPVDTGERKINRLGGLYNQVSRWGIYGENGLAPTLTAAMGMGGGHVPMMAEPVGDTKDKGYCLTANYAGAHPEHTLSKGVRSMVAEPVRLPEYGNEDKARPLNAHYSNNCGGFEHRMFSPNPNKQQVDMIAEPINTTPEGKSQTIKAQYQNTSTVNVCCYKSTYGATGCAELVQVGSLPRPNGELSTSQAMRVYSQEGKSVTQSAGGGGLGGKTGLYAIPVEFEDGIPTKAISCADGKTYTVYKVENGLITIKGKEYPIKLKDGYYIIRKLTVRECARLQTMPDDYCKAVSDSQAYKALGNGWTAEVIIHLLNHALKDVPRDEEIVVLSMYDGIATGRYCLDKMGFTNVTYHAYEIDKYPIMVAMDNYPDIIEHGDAFAVREDDWQPPQTRSEWLDELLGGSQ